MRHINLLCVCVCVCVCACVCVVLVLHLCLSYASVYGCHSSVAELVLSGSVCPSGEGVLPYKGLMGTCDQPGYVFRDFCLKQGIDFIIFCLNQGIDFINFFLKLHCLQSAFSLKIRPDETKKESLCTDVPIPQRKKMSLIFSSPAYALVSRHKRPRRPRA